ncbi:hypothetical protein OQA88_2681 [Cercophora sp. LCS_1]
MDVSHPRWSEDRAGIQLAEGHATADAALPVVAEPQGRSLGPAAKIDGAKTQRAKDATSKLVALSKRGLSKATGEGKASTAKKSAVAKPAPEEAIAKDVTDLRVVFPHDPHLVPRVDIVAVHDVDETFQKAWVYRKRAKRRQNESRVIYASGGINSMDEMSLGTKPKQPASSGKKKVADDSIERWLAMSSRVGDEDVPPEVANDATGQPAERAPSPPLFTPSPFTPSPFTPPDEYDTSSMLAPVPEDDDGDGHFQISDDLFGQRPGGLRRRPTFPKERRKSAPRIAPIAEERAPSVGDITEPRRHIDLISDRQSSDQGLERRVNWLSDFDMLPSDIPGARVMCYTYKSTDKVPSAWQYLTERAEDLVRRIVQKRTSETVDYAKVPIVLIGIGFGALILQRALYLMATSRTDANPTTELKMIASVILLDAPSPSLDREMFPRSRSQETKKTWTQDWLHVGKARTAGTTKIDTMSMWNKFSSIASAHVIPVVWHFSPTVAAPGKPPVTPKTLDALLIPKQSLTAHRLSRFEGPNDIDYRSIMDNIKRSLILICSITRSGKLTACLPDFLRDSFLFVADARDQHGQTPLHLAVKEANPDAVKRLLFQGRASVTKKDRSGRSPLNIAIQEAAHRTSGLQPDSDFKKTYTQIINLLMKNGARVDDKDNDGKTPWFYAEGDGNQWIRRLKDKHLIIGTSSTATGGIDSVVPPKPGPQREAAQAFDMILAEVFLQRKKERYSEVFNFDLASVHEVVYSGSSSLSQILAASRPEQMTADKVRCRWIHVPSNNEQWVHDLMVSMGIQDSSAGGQRHEGSRLIDRYMMPQARRYKHFHTVAYKPPPEPRPKPSRFSSTDSGTTVVLGSHDFPPTKEEVRAKLFKAMKTPSVPETMRVESDAIVLFMPILGFEKHRHRKYLTQAFREADDAMRLARERDESPDPKSLANLKSGRRKQKGRKDETSDDGESNSEMESSRLYPGPVRLTRAREQVKGAREAQLLRGYLDSKQVKPVHCRRTLDQFSYYMLNSTEARDKSQVAYRWAKNPTVCTEPKNRPIIMVDQLWLWAFRDGTVITSSPSTWNGQEDFNLTNVIVRELRYNKDRPIIKSIEDLLHLVLKTSLDFFKRKGPVGFQFHECFQSSINNVSEKQGRLFDNFRRTTKRLHVGKLDLVQRKQEIEFLFSLDEETELLVEIMDIQDELTIVKTILGQQQGVLQNLLRLYPKKVDEDELEQESKVAPSGLGKSELLVLQGLVQLLKDQGSPSEAKVEPRSVVKEIFGGDQAGDVGNETAPQEGLGQKKPKTKGKDKEAEKPAIPTAPKLSQKSSILQNRDLMYETIGIVENNMRIVQDMLAYAEKVESSLENLLDLKQKHANGWEARFAREGSEESQRQGNIILVFTLVTAIFLPLSFMTSFLAMGVDAFPKNDETGEVDWPINQMAVLLFAVSAAISIPLVIIALYVNKLRARARVLWKQLLRALSDPETLLNPALAEDTDKDHDSDDERTFADHQTRNAKARTEASGPDRASEVPVYAPMFGKWHFHSRIPWFRRLWLIQHYRRASVKKKNNRWRDRYVTDYPLHHYRLQFGLGIVAVIVRILTWFGYGGDKNKRIVRRPKEGSDSSSSSSSDSSGSDRDEKGGKRKSMDSGYWKRGEGSGFGGDSWSNQTRSRGSREEEEQGKKKRLGWLRMRRRGKAKIDEEVGEGGELRSV